ncbi:MAG TPA: PQQ-binding-like beta-propeller repeat protein [Armatimonadota bacterium]|nr:PQQ-binding-like beta-propeller repeat protein [Armatimonadota bacterium]
MRNVSRLIGVMVGCMVLLSAYCALAQDWPQWRGIDRDGRVTGFTAPETWPTMLAQKWTVSVGAGDATPALVGDRLYVFSRQGDDEVTRCLNAGDGQQVWEDRYAAQAVGGPASRHPGPRSSPAVAEGKVITLGVAGVLSCLDAATGQVVWRNDPFPGSVPSFFTAMSPIIVNGMVVAQLGNETDGVIVAFDLATGEQKWQCAGEGEGPQYASPVLLTIEDTTMIVTLTAKSVVGVAVADGQVLWQLPFVPQGRAYNAATPIIDGQMVIYTGAGRGTRAVKIVRQGDGFAAEEVWSNPDLGVQFNTPVLEGGLLFGLSAQGNLFCVDAQTGQTAWVNETQLDRGGFGAIVGAGSVVFILPSTPELIAFSPTAEGYTELARIKVAETPTYAHPVIAGSSIFVRDQDAVTLWMFE